MAAITESPKSMHRLSVASLALSSLGLLLFFMPILGLPLSCLGALFAIAALIAAGFGGRWDLRSAVLAVLLAALALTVNLLLMWSPLITAAQHAMPETTSASPRPYISPPDVP